jgi:hypothetical protein
MFKAKTPEGVIEKVRSHLLANGLPPGDLMEEYVQYVYDNWPNLVQIDRSKTPPRMDSHSLTVLDKQHKLGLKPLLNVPEKVEAERRQKMCEACPHNRPLRGAADVIDAINQRAFMLTKGRLNKLGYCTCHLWDNRVATQLDLDLLAPVAMKKTIVPCWFPSSPLEKS